LSAAYAKLGDEKRSRAALYVTLALASDIPKRCVAAIAAVKGFYGDALKDATEAMFKRIGEQDLSASPSCTQPIAW